MLPFFKTAVALAKNFRQTGAIAETSRFVVREISSRVKSDKKQIIWEFGAGLGNITRGILKRMHPESELVAFEINPDFCEALKRDIPDKRLKVVNSAIADVYKSEEFDRAESVDVIISSLPLSLLNQKENEEVMEMSKRVLKAGGWFSQVLYTFHHGEKLKKYFGSYVMQVAINIPPAYVYHCNKTK